MTAVGFMRRASLGDDLHGLHAIADLDPVHDVHAAHDPAEGGVLAVQALVVGEHDEDLAPRGVRVPAARHADDAADELALVELGLDRVARTASAHVRVVERQRLGLGISDLDDEARLDAVEPLAVVEPSAGELGEVVDVPGCVRPEQLDPDLATLLERDHRLRRLRLRRGRRLRRLRRLREGWRGPREDRGSARERANRRTTARRRRRSSSGRSRTNWKPTPSERIVRTTASSTSMGGSPATRSSLTLAVAPSTSRASVFTVKPWNESAVASPAALASPVRSTTGARTATGSHSRRSTACLT